MSSQRIGDYMVQTHTSDGLPTIYANNIKEAREIAKRNKLIISSVKYIGKSRIGSRMYSVRERKRVRFLIGKSEDR
jgi:hypothetical protein